MVLSSCDSSPFFSPVRSMPEKVVVVVCKFQWQHWRPFLEDDRVLLRKKLQQNFVPSYLLIFSNGSSWKLITSIWQDYQRFKNMRRRYCTFEDTQWRCAKRQGRQRLVRWGELTCRSVLTVKYRLLSLGRVGTFQANDLIDQPYGMGFEIVDKRLQVLPPRTLQEVGRRSLISAPGRIKIFFIRGYRCYEWTHQWWTVCPTSYFGRDWSVKTIGCACYSNRFPQPIIPSDLWFSLWHHQEANRAACKLLAKNRI